MNSKNILPLLFLAAGLFAGCLHIEQTPSQPAVSLVEIDAKIADRQRQLSVLINQPAPPADGRSIDDLKKEIQERQARIKFLQDEIDALLRERAPLELYYHQNQTNR